MKKLTIAVLFCIVLTLLSCNREGELKGDVFIVTEGAQNFKLGLVEVSAIPEAEMKKFMEEKKKTVDADIAQRQQEYDSIKQQYDQAYNNYQQASRAYSDAISSMGRATGDYGEFQSRSSDADRYRDQSFAKARTVDDLSAKLGVAERNLNLAKSPAPFFVDMPKPIATTTTDADGKFTMKLPTRGQYALAAHASRQVVGSKEEYYWLVWLHSMDSHLSQLC